MSDTFATKEDIGHLRSSVEQLVAATKEMAVSLQTLILVEERQTSMSRAHEKLREDHDKLKEKVDKWVNRGVGVWAAVTVLASVAWAVFGR